MVVSPFHLHAGHRHHPQCRKVSILVKGSSKEAAGDDVKKGFLGIVRGPEL